VKTPQESPRSVVSRERGKPPLPEAAPQAPPREVLSVPQQPSTPEPQFTVPAPEKSAEPPRETAKGARATAQPESAPPATPAAPRLVDARRIDTPVRYRRTAEQGRVTLKVVVTREGRIANVTVEKSSGHANLDQNALQEARRWRFEPARLDSVPVEQALTVHVDY
jgi:protein TonB